MMAKTGRVNFFKGCDPWEATHAPIDDPVSMLIPAALSELTMVEEKQDT